MDKELRKRLNRLYEEDKKLKKSLEGKTIKSVKTIIRKIMFSPNSEETVYIKFTDNTTLRLHAVSADLDNHFISFSLT